jgi:hypothetical protein
MCGGGGGESAFLDINLGKSWLSPIDVRYAMNEIFLSIIIPYTMLNYYLKE